MRPERGFTLIELLVVISIIALLSSVVMATLSEARSRARDAKRASDISSIMNAVALYASDNGGVYPSMSVACVGVPTGQTCWGDRLRPGSDEFIANVSPYMSTLPADPLPDRGWGDRYLYLNGSVAVNCVGGNPNYGVFIAFRPDDAGGQGSSISCPSGTIKACCNSGPCGNNGGYYCARKVSD